ncbi:hypothetical protein QCA50_005990 [Cerrena zonata]|uniref:Terpene synthase n=1 Tax=Cerrena zonata TaxID=2478898 RepID=A0AAW0GKX9_9APHY
MTTYILPDFFSKCPYQLRVNPLTEIVAQNTQRWVLNIVDYDDKKRKLFLNTKGGVLAGHTYPDADAFHLQVIADFTEWLFCFDDYSDECTGEEARLLADSVIQSFRDPSATCQNDVPVCQMARDITRRIPQTAGPRCLRRFLDTVDSYVRSVVREAAYRDDRSTPDVESYIALRRETSAVRPSFALIEFSAGVDLPDEVIAHPLIRSMEMAINDWTSWTNDIFSYNKEQAVGSTHNLVAAIMYERGVDIQTAINQAGDLCLECVVSFEQCRQALPSWGADVDREVQLYVQGLQDWVAGSLNWSFDVASMRYFGRNGEEMKKSRVVRLLPRIYDPAELSYSVDL